MNSCISDQGVESVDISLEPVRLIRYLLQYGSMPWWAGRNQDMRLQQLITELINQSPVLATGIFCDIGHLPAARKRFVQRLDNPALQSVVKLLQPVEAEFVCKVFDLFTRFANNKGLKETGSRFIIWDAVFEYLITNSSRLFNRSDFIESVTRKVLSEGDIDKDSLTTYINTKNECRADKEFIQILEEKKSKPTERKKKEGRHLTDDWIYLKNILLKDIMENSSSVKVAVRKGWRNLFNHGDQTAFSKIKTLAGSRLVRHNMSILLPDSEIKHIVKLAEPANASFILDQSRRTEKIRQSIPDLQIPKTELKAKSWEFILTYLFEDKGSQFNRKQFLRSTLEQFAAHYNLRYSSLLKYFIVFTSDEKTGSSLAVHSLLKDLEKDEQSLYQVNKEPALWSDPGRLTTMTRKARLMTFTGVTRSAEELYQFAKHDPELLSYLLRTEKFSKEGLNYIWNFMSRSQKGIVLMAVSPSKISGWEQIISQIETIAIESKSIRRSVDLDNVFDLVFKYGVLKDADMETLLSLYLDELVLQNQSSREKILKELGRAQQADDRHLMKYLKLQAESGVKQKNGSLKKIDQITDATPKPLLSRIDRLFQLSEDRNSEAVIDLFKSLNGNELQRASLYISSKQGWKTLAEQLSPDHWRVWIVAVLKGELLDQTLKVYDLFLQIYQTEYSGKSLEIKLQKIQGEMTQILLHHSADMNGRRLMQELLKIEDDESGIRLKPEAVRQIQKTVSSAQTPFFNQWMEWQNGSADTSVRKQPSSQNEKTPDVVRVLKLLKKLQTQDPNSNDILQFPLLMHLLENRNESVEKKIFESLRKSEVVKRWAKSLPASILSEITGSLIPEKHLNKATQMLRQIGPAMNTVQPQLSKQRVEAEIMFRYSAGHRYQDYTTSEFIKQVLIILADSLPLSVREKRIKEISAQIVKLLKKHSPRDVTSIKKMLRSFSAEPMETQTDSTVSDSEESDDYKSLKKAFDLDEHKFEGEALYTDRAGLVLAAPFLPRLFEKLGYLTDGLFTDEETRSRAVHILEFLVTGLQNVEEHELVLQKFLIGLPIHTPVDPLETLTDEEIETCESMLYGLIANWQAIGHTTLEGLRGGFLIREGKLQKSDDQWSLSVQTQSIDVLLDRIPWSIGMIKLPWMKHLLRVEWR